MSSTRQWEDLYNQVPLLDVPRHFAGIQQAPFLLEYLKTVLQLCPRSGRSCEVGVGSGYGAVWLSRRGVQAAGIDNAPGIVERARQVNNILQGQAAFRLGDMFAFYGENKPRYQVIHHQGVLEHFAVPWIRAALAQQVALADHVVFSVPSIHYPFEPEFGNERLLDLDEWKRILSPFEVAELRLYGDPQLGGREHVLGVLRGQPVDEALLHLMTVAEEPYAPGISAIVHTRNEARHIADCLRSLQGWTDEIIVCDMESSDDTVAIARGFTEQILAHPLISNFDRARNASAMRASRRWVFYLDADERVPPALGQALKQLAQQPEPSFEGLLIPFRHHFVGHWMQCLYPGYTAPRLFKNGRFHFNPRLHAGAEVEGRVVCFPADDPGLALAHYSFDSLSHYLGKLNRYTDGEAANLHRDGQPFHWQGAIRHFVREFQSYYDRGGATQDGVHGFLYAFHSAFYRFEQHAKLFELRCNRNELRPEEGAIPQSVEQVLEYALSVLREPSLPQAQGIQVAAPAPASRIESPQEPALQAQVPIGEAPEAPHGQAQSGEAQAEEADLEEAVAAEPVTSPEALVGSAARSVTSMVWSGPLYHPSGYGEESRHFVLGLEEAGVAPSIQPLPWSHSEVDLGKEERALLREMAQRPVAPGFVHITQDFPPSFRHHPQAGVSIGRTMFETDRLPVDWVRHCNRMDYIWVPTEFNRQTFAQSGVEAHKLVVIPGCFNAASFQDAPPVASPEDAQRQAREVLPPAVATLHDPFRFTFLSVFDWSRHKGWDVLLRAFVQEFEGRDEATLIFKVWSTLGHTPERILEMASEFARRELSHNLLSDGRIRFVFERLTRAQLSALYQSCDAFVLPSRGEGWGRPYMEAMACGKPTIGTRWSGNLAFMNEANSFLIDCRVVPVPEIGWREIPTYRGHRWAEPDAGHLRQLLRRVVEERSEAAAIGQAGREHVLTHCDRKVVGRLIQQELERLRQAHTASGAASNRQQVLAARPASPSQAEEAHAAAYPDEAHAAVSFSSVAEVKLSGDGAASDGSRRSGPVRVRWEGAFFEWHSLAHVNRELCLGLSQQASPPPGQEGRGVELSLVPIAPSQFDPREEPQLSPLASLTFAPLSGPADVHVRHFFPPRLNRPEQGRFVLIQPWEYGFLPQEWIEPIRDNVDEVWCYSEYVRQVYRDSGIPEEKLQVVPLGVDTDVFHPHALPYIFTSEPGAARFLARAPWAPLPKGAEPGGAEPGKAGKGATGESERSKQPFFFLFTGGTLHRKGIDILLDAYLKAFSAYDDVCLVIKDTGTQTVYRGQNQREQILELVGDETRPPIIYIEDDLSTHQLAGLYATADCLVQPYRGEGFCLPALEAMACGCPVIVPQGGPTDDFVDESVGWRLPATRQPFSVGTDGLGRIGHWECVGPTWMFEVAADDLARQMRQVHRDREEAARRGAAASARVREGWTWQLSRTRVLQRLEALRQLRPLQDMPVLEENGIEAPEVKNGSSDVESGSEGTSGSTSETGGAPSPQISLCMIVRDEERVLGDCLSSIAPWVDEVIVVDTGSTDRTVEIAREHGARVFHFPWCDDFSSARNESLRHATGDWVLWMDADDTIPPACGQKLRDLALLAEEKTTGFMMQVHIPPAPGQHGFTVVDHVKLFRNRLGLRFEGRIHEQILEPIHRHGGRVERSDLYVVHSGYDYSPQGQHKKRERDLLLLQKDLEERPGHPFVLFNIGMTAYHLKDYAHAQPALERCLALCKPRESIVRKVYAMLAGCHLEQGRVAAAREVLERGLGLFPQDPELLFRAGIIYREAGDLQQAEASYLRLLNQREVGHIDSLDVTMTGFKAHHNLALIYQDKGQLEEAERHFRQAVEQQPDFVPSWLGLAEVQLQGGRLQKLPPILSTLRQLDHQEARRLEERIERMIQAASSAASTVSP